MAGLLMNISVSTASCSCGVGVLGCEYPAAFGSLRDRSECESETRLLKETGGAREG